VENGGLKNHRVVVVAVMVVVVLDLGDTLLTKNK
jgi:hypothetical protein